MKSGFVSFTGRPNAGKSTLINQIIGEKIAITSNKPQTTRNIIQGIYNDEDSQIIFVDTPGIHKAKTKLGDLLNKGAYYSIDDVDIICYIVDATKTLGNGDKFVIQKFTNINKPVVLVLNKIDNLKNEEIMSKILGESAFSPGSDIVPISALKNKNINELLKVIKTHLKENFKYYGEDIITNKSINFMIEEIIREKVLRLTEEEVPYSVTCVLEKITKNKDKTIINAEIIADKQSAKKIIIGKNGQMLKKIGTYAREDIEMLLETKVYLELYVKVIENWKDREKYLTEFKFNDFLE